MPLTPIPTMMAHALEYQYAVGYFEGWNFESLQGVIDAAEQSHSPVIIGFNGEFMSRPERIAHERLDWYGALGKAAAASASVPVGFIFNECAQHEWVWRAVTAGFNLVMPVPAEGETVETYTLRVRDVTHYAHEHSVAVEAELGTLPYGDGTGGEATDPAQAVEFTSATGIDLLAVSVGNVHVLLNGQKALDIQKIAAIHATTSVPLVLHGGTGISRELLQEAIGLGVTKVNYGTYLKLSYLETMRKALATDEADPHHLLGGGDSTDVLIAGRYAVRDAVLDRIPWLGCAGKADAYG